MISLREDIFRTTIIKVRPDLHQFLQFEIVLFLFLETNIAHIK